LLLEASGLRYNGDGDPSGAQTERRGGAGPVGGLLGGKDPTGRFILDASLLLESCLSLAAENLGNQPAVPFPADRVRHRPHNLSHFGHRGIRFVGLLQTVMRHGQNGEIGGIQLPRRRSKFDPDLGPSASKS
jgi:hypothetical protein